MAATTQQSSPRKVLGQLSTNVQLTPKVSTDGQAKSPKRSFKTAIGDHGFSYLKRRRLSSTTPFPDIAQSTEGTESMDGPHESRTIPLRAEGEAEAPENDRESSSERHSFSSLINYDPSSQTGPSSQSRTKAVTPEDSPTMALSRAELLRMRLQVAIYKVRTNQTEVPFDYLREDTSSGSRESSKAVQEAVEQLRQEAYARLRTTNTRPAIALAPALSSSPPRLSPERRQFDMTHLTVTPNIRNNKASPSKRLGLDLTSSAVKGQVAEGLLDLKNGF